MYLSRIFGAPSSTQRGKSTALGRSSGDLRDALFRPGNGIAPLSFSLLFSFPLSRSPPIFDDGSFRWNEFCWLTARCFFRSLRPSLFFLSPASIRRHSSRHHRRRWNSDRKIRGSDRAAARQSSRAPVKNLRGEISRELRLSRSS